MLGSIFCTVVSPDMIKRQLITSWNSTYTCNIKLISSEANINFFFCSLTSSQSIFVIRNVIRKIERFWLVGAKQSKWPIFHVKQKNREFLVRCWFTLLLYSCGNSVKMCNFPCNQKNREILVRCWFAL